MRNEMITFKALVDTNFPQLSKKLKMIGFPLTLLVYKPMLNMYTNYFSSSIVLQLWDMIFLSLNSHLPNQIGAKGLWYILAPAMMVLRKLETQLLNADSFHEII